MVDFDTGVAKPVAVATGVLGLLLALALDADLLGSGIWYPVFYAGAPALTATAVFRHERPDAGPLGLLAVGVWVLVSSVLALAVAVVLTLGFPADVPPSPARSVISAGLLYLGFLLVPVGLAVAAARRRGIRTVLLLLVSPVGQAVIAAVLIISR